MTHCPFDTGLEILSSDGSSTVFDFHDHAAGYCLEFVRPPEESMREIRVTAPRVDDSFLLAWAEDDGVLQALVHVHGSTWGEVESRWQEARTAYRGATRYPLRHTLDGASYTYRAERPFRVTSTDITVESAILHRQTYLLQWRVMSNPTVTPAAEES